MPTLPIDRRLVTEVPAARPADALAHFSSLFAYETDCWDVHAALAAGDDGFVVLDARGPDAFAAGKEFAEWGDVAMRLAAVELAAAACRVHATADDALRSIAESEARLDAAEASED